MASTHVYRAPPQWRQPQIYRGRPYQPYTLSWLYDRATQQYKVLGTISSTSPLAGVTPAIASGDIWVAPLVVSPDGYALTLFETGDYSIDAGGDTSRQSFTHNVYDLSLSAFYGAGTVYDGNQAPQFIGGGPAFFNGTVYKKNVDQGTISLSVAWNDPESDTISHAVQSGALPTGWSLASNGDITGTPTAYGTYTYTDRVTDTPGDYTDLLDIVVIGDESPNVVGQAEATAVSNIESVANFTVDTPVDTAYSGTVPEGDVISQFPAAGEIVADDTVFSLVVSSGLGAVISETFIDEDGFVLANLTGITVLIWRAATPDGAPDVTLTDQTTDGSGVATWGFDPGSLAEDDPVFYVAYSGDPPISFTAGLVIPTLPS